jgi:hypothetical protein
MRSHSHQTQPRNPSLFDIGSARFKASILELQFITIEIERIAADIQQSGSVNEIYLLSQSILERKNTALNYIG